MGTTAATLHLLHNPEIAPDYPSAVAKAYTKLGWAPPKRGETATRHIVLARSGPFITLHDSHCAQLDDGSLRQAGALLSKSVGSAAIVTTLYDSDAFTFLLYAKGKQVDGVANPPFPEDEAIKSVRGKRQATVWWEALQFGHFANVMRAGPRMSHQLERFVELAKAIPGIVSPSADDALAAWCALAGLGMDTVVATAADAERAGQVIGKVALTSRPVAAKPDASQGPQARVLAFEMSPDDFPYHGFFPSPYPCIPAAPDTYTWGVTCRGGGIGRLRFRLTVARDGAFTIRKLDVQAHSFHNGQIMSEKPLASAERVIGDGDAQSAAELVLDAPGFGLHDPVEGSRAGAVLLVTVSLTAPAAGDLTLRPELTADDVVLDLPPLRLRAEKPVWVPPMARLPGVTRARIMAVLQLNTPALHNAIGIVAEPQDAARAAIRALAEAFVAPAGPARAVLHVTTMKQMTASFSIPKAKLCLPVGEALDGKRWAGWFNRDSAYQTVTIGIAAPNAPWPLAGLNVQTRTQSPHGLDQVGQVFVSLWANADADALAALGLNWAVIASAFDAWIAAAAPEQGWRADCAWIPLFSTWEDSHVTPYEALVEVSAAKRHAELLGTALTATTPVLRYVAPLMWLGDSLAGALPHGALEAVSHVAPIDRGLRVTLRPQATMAELEQVLLPVLAGK